MRKWLLVVMVGVLILAVTAISMPAKQLGFEIEGSMGEENFRLSPALRFGGALLVGASLDLSEDLNIKPRAGLQMGIFRANYDWGLEDYSVGVNLSPLIVDYYIEKQRLFVGIAVDFKEDVRTLKADMKPTGWVEDVADFLGAKVTPGAGMDTFDGRGYASVAVKIWDGPELDALFGHVPESGRYYVALMKEIELNLWGDKIENLSVGGGVSGQPDFDNYAVWLGAQWTLAP